jgi:hypothetical protein
MTEERKFDRVEQILEKLVHGKGIEHWLSFLKYFLGSVVLGFYAMTMNADYQAAKLAQQIKESDQKFAQQFLDNYVSKSLIYRLNFAKYFSFTLGGKWEGYYKALEKEYLDKMAEIGRLERIVSELKNKQITPAVSSSTINMQIEQLRQMTLGEDTQAPVILVPGTASVSEAVIAPVEPVTQPRQNVSQIPIVIDRNTAKAIQGIIEGSQRRVPVDNR